MIMEETKSMYVISNIGLKTSLSRKKKKKKLFDSLGIVTYFRFDQFSVPVKLLSPQAEMICLYCQLIKYEES